MAVPRMLSQLAKEQGFFLIYISTDVSPEARQFGVQERQFH